MYRISWCAVWIAWLLFDPPLTAAERWEIQYFYDKNDSTLSFTDLEFPSAQRGVALGIIFEQRRRKPVVAVTANGGQTWDLLPLKERGTSLFFLAEQSGWMVSEKGRLWRTSDAGRTWSPVELRGVRAEPLRVFFLDQSRGYLLCSQKHAYSTSDGGRSWQLVVASRDPNVPDARSLYTRAAFFKELVLLTGWSRLAERRPLLPDWMEPETAPLGRRATTAIFLHTRDGGKNWKADLLPGIGEIVRIRISSEGAALLLIRRLENLLVPTELVELDLKTLRGKPVYANKDRWLTDIAFAGPHRIFAAALDQEGRSPFPNIPAKLKVLQSSNAAGWTEMQVDYRAEARNALLAVPDPSHAWLATDTGMILRWIKE